MSKPTSKLTIANLRRLLREAEEAEGGPEEADLVQSRRSMDQDSSAANQESSRDRMRGGEGVPEETSLLQVDNHTPLTGFSPENYERKHRLANTKLINFTQAYLRNLVAIYLRPGYTIKFQNASKVLKVIRDYQHKLPGSGPKMMVRQRLVALLNRNAPTRNVPTVQVCKYLPILSLLST